MKSSDENISTQVDEKIDISEPLKMYIQDIIGVMKNIKQTLPPEKYKEFISCCLKIVKTTGLYSSDLHQYIKSIGYDPTTQPEGFELKQYGTTLIDYACMYTKKVSLYGIEANNFNKDFIYKTIQNSFNDHYNFDDYVQFLGDHDE